jgi:hypothetical protein
MSANRDRLLRALQDAEELQRRHRDGGIRYFEPASETQSELLACRLKGRIAIGGNRSGKTVAGAVKTCRLFCGEDPHAHRPSVRRGWCISQELPGSSDRPHVQLEAVRRWMPADALRGRPACFGWSSVIGMAAPAPIVVL